LRSIFEYCIASHYKMILNKIIQYYFQSEFSYFYK
jgi:hypothetical protein